MKNHRQPKDHPMLTDIRLAAVPPIQIWDNGIIYIESCRGILDMGDGYLQLKVGKTAVTLWGADLELVSYRDRRLLIRGSLSSIEFEGRNAR